jgi:predicted PurR-regulated permease PerM
MKWESNDISQKSLIKTIILAGIVLLVVIYFSEALGIVKNIYGVISPLLLGAAIAYVLNLLVALYEKIYFPKSRSKRIIKTRRGVCILLSVFTIMAILLFFLGVVIPQFGRSIQILSAGFPALYNNLLEWANQHADQIPLLKQKLQELNMDGAALMKKVMDVVGSWAGGTVSLMGSVFGQIFNWVLAIIFAIYLLFGMEDLKKQFSKILRTYVKEERRAKLHEVMGTANETFSSYIIGQCKEAVILGILCTAGMLIFGFPYATVIGPVMGLTALIPMLGSYIGAGIGFLLIVMVDPFTSLMFLIFVLVLQQVEGNLIYPKVVGKSIGLPGIWVFTAIIIGGGLLGITGVILGVPIAATVYKLMSRTINERLRMEQEAELP